MPGSSSTSGPTISGQPADKKPRCGGMPPKPVEQVDLATGRAIAQFDSQADAARATRIDAGGISGCVRDEYGFKSAGGFGWRTPGSGGAAGAASGSRHSRPALSKPSTGTAPD